MNCNKIISIRGLITFLFLCLLGVQVSGQIISQSDALLNKKQNETNFLLDVPPGRDGLIEDVYIKHLMTIKKIVFPF